MLLKEKFFALDIVFTAYDLALKIQSMSIVMADNGSPISSVEMRDRLLACMSRHPRYEALATIITTRMRFHAPDAAAQPLGADHGITWEALFREVRNYDLENNPDLIVNKADVYGRAARTTSSQHVSK
jgi:hypothetical protein